MARMVKKDFMILDILLEVSYNPYITEKIAFFCYESKCNIVPYYRETCRINSIFYDCCQCRCISRAQIHLLFAPLHEDEKAHHQWIIRQHARFRHRLSSALIRWRQMPGYKIQYLSHHF